jgi:hypothetical protein
MPLPSVKVIEESRVAVPATAALPPEPLRLSALDAQWVTLPLIQRVFIFVDGGGRGDIPPFESAVDALRASLAETAARFPPLAGRIVHRPATGDAAIDCAGGGVRFVVAESGEADAGRLAGGEDHVAEAFRSLVPALDAGQLPAETMAAQVTRLRGGLALGVAMHHAVADGRSAWRFLEAWAAACRGDADDDAEPPTFDRAAIELPGGDELARAVLRKYAPDLPMVRHANLLPAPSPASFPSPSCVGRSRTPAGERRSSKADHQRIWVPVTQPARSVDNISDAVLAPLISRACRPPWRGTSSAPTSPAGRSPSPHKTCNA